MGKGFGDVSRGLEKYLHESGINGPFCLVYSEGGGTRAVILDEIKRKSLERSFCLKVGRVHGTAEKNEQGGMC